MKIVFIWSFYEIYLKNFYVRFPELTTSTYEEQYSSFLKDYFGSPGSQMINLLRQKQEAILIINNCEPLQKKWAQENRCWYEEKNWKFQIAFEQIKRFKPDIIFTGTPFEGGSFFLDELNKLCAKVFGWIACPISSDAPLHKLSLILSSSQHYVDNFRRIGIDSELLPTSFDSDILMKLSGVEQDISVSFIGGLSNVHHERVVYLKELAKRTSIKIWGYGLDKEYERSFVDILRGRNVLQRRYQGEVWGMEMYRIIKRSKITFNMHIAEAKNLAGNMRMYEATGLGSLLISDFKSNADDIFKEGKEAVYYHSLDDAVNKINYYLNHEEERKLIATSGQQRTLKEYNFEENAKQLLWYFKKYLNK